MNEIDNLFKEKNIIDERLNNEIHIHKKRVILICVVIGVSFGALLLVLSILFIKYQNEKEMLDLYSNASDFCTGGGLVKKLEGETISVDQPYKDKFNSDYGTYFTFPSDEKSQSYIEVVNCNVIEAKKQGDSFWGYSNYIEAEVDIKIPLEIDGGYYYMIVSGVVRGRYTSSWDEIKFKDGYSVKFENQ